MNRFPFPTTLKNVYRGASSLVPRVLLLQPDYATNIQVREEIRRRGGDLALSTISKALKLLAEELIVGKGDGVRLLQPEKLLDRLTAEFRASKVRQRLRGKLPGDPRAVISRLVERAECEVLPLAVTGAGSTSRYAVMERGDMVSVYTGSAARLLRGLPVEETIRFPNLEVIETQESTVYFDLRPEGDIPWASPIQTYLELVNGDKRDRETAEQVRQVILSEPQTQAQRAPR